MIGYYRTGAMEQVVYIHSASALARVRPEWVVYQDLFEVTGGKVRDDQSETFILLIIQSEDYLHLMFNQLTIQK